MNSSTSEQETSTGGQGVGGSNPLAPTAKDREVGGPPDILNIQLPENVPGWAPTWLAPEWVKTREAWRRTCEVFLTQCRFRRALDAEAEEAGLISRVSGEVLIPYPKPVVDRMGYGVTRAAVTQAVHVVGS